jgi:hypothetical protein
LKPILTFLLCVASISVHATETKFSSASECSAVYTEIRSTYKLVNFGTYVGNGKVIRIGCHVGGGFLIVRTTQEEAEINAKINRDMAEERALEKRFAKGVLSSHGL